MNTGTFYNTTGISGQPLTKATEKAKSEEVLVLEFMREHPLNSYTACEVWLCLTELGRISSRKPLTSIRRAMNTLLNKGKICKMDARRKGYYGELVHTWRVADKPVQGNFNF